MIKQVANGRLKSKDCRQCSAYVACLYALLDAAGTQSLKVCNLAVLYLLVVLQSNKTAQQFSIIVSLCPSLSLTHH